MGDIGDFLFGEGQEASQLPQLTTEQSALLAKLSSLLTGQVGAGVSPYPGQLAPGPSGLQTGGFQAIQDLLGGAGQLTPVQGSMESQIMKLLGGETTGGLGQGLQDIVSGAKTMGEPAYAGGMETLKNMLKPYSPESTVKTFKKYIEPQAMELFEEQLKPLVESYVSKGGTKSGAFQQALVNAGGDMSANLATMLGKQIFGDEQTHKALQSGGIEQALGYYGAPMDVAMTGFKPQMDVASLGLKEKLGGMEAGMGFGGQQFSQLLQTIQAALGGGGTQRDITGQMLQDPFQKWQASQPYANPWLQQLSTAFGTQPYGYMQMGTPKTSFMDALNINLGLSK